MSTSAIAKGVKMSPRKVSAVADLVRGRTVEDALTILRYTPRHSALPVLRVIASAKANAENNHNLKPASLKIISIEVTAGKRAKRFRAAARGMALPYQKKTSHIKVVVDGEKREPKKAKAEPAKENK